MTRTLADIPHTVSDGCKHRLRGGFSRPDVVDRNRLEHTPIQLFTATQRFYRSLSGTNNRKLILDFKKRHGTTASLKRNNLLLP